MLKPLKKGMGKGGRGGARHFSKPYVDAGLLLKLLSKHEEIMKDFKSYEALSRNSGIDPRGLVNALHFVNDVLDLAPSCELHPQPLRNGLIQLLSLKPQLNTTKFNGCVWANLRAERVGVVLAHVRKLARNGTNPSCCGALTSMEFQWLKTTLEKVQLKESDHPDTLAKEDSLSQGDDQKNILAKGKKYEASDEAGEPAQNTSGSKGPLPATKIKLKPEQACGSKGPLPTAKKKLKKNISDVSVDSDGFPKMLESPPKQEVPQKAAPTRIFKKAIGNPKPTAYLPNLKGAMGWKQDKPATSVMKTGLKKPAAAAKRPAALQKAGESPKTPACSESKPWLSIRKTMASKPERCYLTGTKEKGGKLKLVVEVPKTWSNRYPLVIDKIKEAMLAENLSKEEAVALRSKLCKQYP